MRGRVSGWKHPLGSHPFTGERSAKIVRFIETTIVRTSLYYPVLLDSLFCISDETFENECCRR